MSERAKPLVNLWVSILRDKASDNKDDVSFAKFMTLLLGLGPPIGLAIGRDKMAKHGLPLWSAVIAPLIVEMVCFWYLFAKPQEEAEAIVRTARFLPDTIKAKTDLLRTALTDAANLSSELEEELNVSNAALRDIEQQVADNRELVNLNKPAADAVVRALGKDAAQRDAKNSRKSCLWGLIWFLAGSAVTILATMFSGTLTLR